MQFRNPCGNRGIRLCSDVGGGCPHRARGEVLTERAGTAPPERSTRRAQSGAGVRRRGRPARCSDLANLLVTNLALEDRGLVVTVRLANPSAPHTHRTRPGSGHQPHDRLAGLVCGRGPARRSRAAAGGPPGRLGARKLPPQAVNEILLHADASAGLDYRLTAHGLRSGLATEARRAGASDDKVADQGRWARGSTTLHSYFRRVDRWTINALSKLGL